MTRDGTVGRSDATEPNLASHWDIDPVRMMRTRFADPIRASSPPGLHQQAGHMTASDLCAARQMISCQAGPSTHELRTGLWRPTLEDENGKPLAGLGLLAKPTHLAIVPWLLVFFIGDASSYRCSAARSPRGRSRRAHSRRCR